MPFKNAFITGASSGIGEALARRLAAHGTHVVAAARRIAELQSLVDRVRDSGGHADACVLDVTDPAAVQQAISYWDQESGGLDLVIANAGVGVARNAQQLRWETDIAPLIAVNVTGAFATLQAGMRVMLARGRGTLAGVSSLAALRGLPASGAYAATKAALATFLETLRLDLAHTEIQVIDIRPGFVDTDMTRPNRFKMPFLLTADDAAKRIAQGLDRGVPIVAFPWPIVAATALAEVMPDRLWRMLGARVRPRA